MRVGTVKPLVFFVGIVALCGVKAFPQETKDGGPDAASPAAAVLQPASAPPPVDSMNAASSASTGFSFKVVTDPVGATVLLDDSLWGESPCAIAGVTAGKHILTIKKKGFYLKKAEIVVDSTSEREFSFTLLRPGFLRVESDPAGSEVSIDGKKMGVTPYENDKVKPGEHAITLSLKHYIPVERAVAMENGGRDTVRCALEHTAAYNDSVTASRRLEKRANGERTAFGIASALFCAGAVIMVLVELAGNK